MSESSIDFMDLISHRAAWRSAIEIARDHAEVRQPDIDDVSYWDHELAVFDRTLGVLDRKGEVSSDVSAATNLDRFFDIVSDKLIFLSTAGLQRDAMFTMPIFTNSERVYEVMSNFLYAVQNGGLMKYVEGGHATNRIMGTDSSDAHLVRNIVVAFEEFDADTSRLLYNMVSDALFHAPHMRVYSERKIEDIRANVFARWEREFEFAEDQLFDFSVTCMDGISPACDLLADPQVRDGFTPSQFALV